MDQRHRPAHVQPAGGLTLPGATLWFELMDTSAADGTPLAIERIKLTIQ